MIDAVYERRPPHEGPDCHLCDRRLRLRLGRQLAENDVLAWCFNYHGLGVGDEMSLPRPYYGDYPELDRKAKTWLGWYRWGIVPIATFSWFAFTVIIVSFLNDNQEVAVGSERINSLPVASSLGISGQFIGGNPETCGYASKDCSYKSEPNSGTGKPPIFTRFFLSIVLFLCGLGFSIWGGEYLYRDRIFIATSLFGVGSFLSLCGFGVWMLF